MSTRQYIGARYVPKIFNNPNGSAEWVKETSYEALTIVTYLGNSYTSKKPVPVNTDITNSEYWVITGNYNAHVEEYRKEVELLRCWVTPQMFGAKSDGVTNDYDALIKACNWGVANKKPILITRDTAYNGTITLSNFLTIRGGIPGVKLIALGALPMIKHDEGLLFYCEVSSLILDGKSIANNGIEIGASTASANFGLTNCKFDRLYVMKCTNIGILVRNRCLTFQLTNCWVSDCANSGIYMQGSDVLLSNVYVFGCCKTGNFGGMNIGGSNNLISDIYCYLNGNTDNPTAGGIVCSATYSNFSNVTSQENKNFQMNLTGAYNTFSNLRLDGRNLSAGTNGLVFLAGATNTIVNGCSAYYCKTGIVLSSGNNNNYINAVTANNTTNITNSGTGNTIYNNGALV